MTTSVDAAGTIAIQSRSSSLTWLPGLLTIGVFVNAALIFSAEPMFSKLLLPFLGGTPTVWNTCLVFFQAALLCGYLYAHFATRLLGPRLHPPVHIALLALSCLALPLQIRLHGDPPAGGGLGVIWIFALLLVSLGAPFVMLASGALVAQRWLSDTDHPRSANPYFLYAASNLGSLIALLAYPLLIEPWLTLSAQRAVWSIAYVVLVAIVAICGWVVVRAWRPLERTSLVAVTSSFVVRWRHRARWVLYAAVPSMLLVAVTTYLSTDVAAVPLLWVLPLAVYLLTFVFVFATRQLIPALRMHKIETYMLIGVTIPILWDFHIPASLGIPLQLSLLFVVSMVCHAELVRIKPPPARLTEFFVWMSVGGLIGGIFTAILAPIVFDSVLEYPIALTLAAFLQPGPSGGSRARRMDLALPLLAGAALIAARQYVDTPGKLVVLFASVILGTVLFSFRNRPLRFALGLGSVFVAGYLIPATGDTSVLYMERSFFGVYRVDEKASDNMRTLSHGTTVHGAQVLGVSQRLVPNSYYHPSGPAGDIFRLSGAGMRPNRRVGVVGLGTGALACYGSAGERWTFYEIDPLVASIARNATLFTFLRDCSPSVDIILGDARLKIAHAGGQQYDILVLDAFSSDAIPVHLLTREALQEYLAVTTPDGLIAIHISNRHLDLEPVIAEAARNTGLSSRLRIDRGAPKSPGDPGRYASEWAILARTNEPLGALASDSSWRSLHRRSDVHEWTDDFSNILSVFNFAWRN